MHSRIDQYITRKLTTKTCKANPTSISDHNSVAVRIQIKKEPKGSGCWKLKTSILKHQNCRDIFTDFWKDWEKNNKIPKPQRMAGSK